MIEQPRFKKLWRQHVWLLRTKFGVFRIVPHNNGMWLTYRMNGRKRRFDLGNYVSYARASYIGRMLATQGNHFQWDVARNKVP